ncbi:low molecular weight protein-tyrosine-phosphatase [Novosphingobium sp.]|jgi:protein-tyrosine phosphatase|uniref:low molecular weight protein-tyrosine-phosphatase n=1 Tax=Novosphingobium sp. TaxID=1874826 RepID=UPI001ECBE499|nr:low molecular weight protein-tyrosine-phosphatase [Novosphingobium sp.]MBK6802133.1 low molecular weight phosphotyrosine protein phosphatase [Novosphingobium sp.]MBK9009811.1 low molecular weight phosphotyrosine protein phosphatase [Novosphingobium sp.]
MAEPSVLFVCLGNICRSPLAEAAFRTEAERAGLNARADSAGTAGYHIGEPPDPRAIRTARTKGIDISGYRGRQASAADFHAFTHIFALDHSNLRNLERIAPAGHPAQLRLLLDLIPGREGQAVADPWYGGEAGFEVTWAEVSAAARALVAELAK